MEYNNMIYKDFTPSIKELPSLNIIEPRENLIPKIPYAMKRITKPRGFVATKKVTYVPKCVLPPTYTPPPSKEPNSEVVAVEEVSQLFPEVYVLHCFYLKMF